METKTKEYAVAFGIIGGTALIGLGAKIFAAKRRSDMAQFKYENALMPKSIRTNKVSDSPHRTAVKAIRVGSTQKVIEAYYYTIRYNTVDNPKNETVYCTDKEKLIRDMNRMLRQLYVTYPYWEKDTDGYGKIVSYTLRSFSNYMFCVVVSTPNWGTSTKISQATDEIQRAQGLHIFEYQKR